MADTSKLEEPDQVKVEAQSSDETNNVKEQKNNLNNEIVEKEKIKKEATLLFLQGKRSVYIRDFQAAVAALSESCQLFNKIYSEQDDAMADPYFYYGKALLEVGRSESEVLGDQMQDEDDDNENDGDDDADDNDEDEEEVPVKTDGENKEESKTDNGAENAEDCVKNGQKPDGSDAANEDKVNNESENDDINDLQLSWEYLELAKLIYSKKSNTCKETAIKLAETFLCLGENGLESENYSVAIEDIKQALEIQKKHLQEFDRRIAETYYQLGIAHSLGQNYDEAITNFKMAIEQLNKKISSLETRKEMGDGKTEDEEKDAFYTMDGEIKEIQVVIKAIEEKIKDMLECKIEVKAELIKQVISGRNQAGSSSSNDATTKASSSVSATDISHLIKKKRKNDEEEANSEKKTKME